MKKHRLMGLVLSAALFSIFLPMVLMLLWSVAGRWPWPGLLPETYSLRTIKELLTGSASLPRLLSSSILLALTVAVLGTAVGVMTARATENYGFPGRSLVRFGSLLPLLVPGTVFAMGIQITLIRLGLSDTVAGVVLVPYIQSGDRSLSSVYSTAFVGSALLVFFIFEGIIHRIQKGERKP